MKNPGKSADWGEYWDDVASAELDAVLAGGGAGRGHRARSGFSQACKEEIPHSDRWDIGSLDRGFVGDFDLWRLPGRSADRLLRRGGAGGAGLE